MYILDLKRQNIIMFFCLHYVLLLLVVEETYGGTKQKRIIEPNEDAERDEHPWMVLLTDPKQGFCGGVIINRCNLLTAAHCFTLGAPINKVFLGIHHSYFSNHGTIYRSGRKKNGFTYHIHKDAVSRTDWIPDIALIRLSNPLNYSNKIQPMCLSDEPPMKGWDITTYGWGHNLLSKKGKKQDTLKKRKDQIQRCSDIDCIIRPEITGRGDSGGPWIIPGKDINGTEKTCLIGLTESSPRNGVDRFTSIAEFVNNGWIKNTMKKMDKKQEDECNGINHFDICKPDENLRERCTDLTLKDNMVLSSGSLTNNRAGDLVRVRCKFLYIPTGSTQFLCTSRGRWKPDTISECRKYKTK